MSADEWQRFDEAMHKLDQVARLVGLFKAAIISAFGVCIFVAGMAVWVNKTEAQVQQTREDLHALINERSERLKEWDIWRRQKDDIDVRLSYVVEAQQRAIDRFNNR